MTGVALASVDAVIAAGLAPAADRAALDDVAAAFRIRISPAMAGVMTGPADPVARQFVPSPAELTLRPEELADPIGDAAHSPTPGLTHRYPDRVILHATQTCEVYCRFCFRRETVGEDGPLSDAALDAALAYVAQTPAIWEVILTGGDPMVLSARRLAALLARLSDIPHVQVIRFHTRVPVVAPDRITPALLAALQTRATVQIVIHTNHANELTAAACDALKRLAQAGLPLLAQTVLLAGVNDDAETLATLFRSLIVNRVKPYYLHHCDLARGTSQFRTTIARGQAIMAQLRGRVSGICLPLYVLDIPGGQGKVPIGPGYLTEIGPGHYSIADPAGKPHPYHDPTT